MLKNLAAVLAAEEGTAAQALALYGEAAMLDDGDIVLWNRMGALVCMMLSGRTHQCSIGICVMMSPYLTMRDAGQMLKPPAGRHEVCSRIGHISTLFSSAEFDVSGV